MKLMYNAKNDKVVTLDQLKAVKTPEARGARHMPYAYSSFVEQVMEALDKENININTGEYAVQKDHNRFFGIMDLTGNKLTEDKDWNLLLGLRGSHDQSIPRGLTLGSQVLVCSNLCFSGNLGTVKTKQTTNIESRIPALIQDAVARIPEVAEQQQLRYNSYRDYEITQAEGDAALVDIFRHDGLTLSQLKASITQWAVPEHDEHAEHGFSAWRLMNACTEALKPSSSSNAGMNSIQERSSIVENCISDMVGVTV